MKYTDQQLQNMAQRVLAAVGSDHRSEVYKAKRLFITLSHRTGYTHSEIMTRLQIMAAGV